MLTISDFIDRQGAMVDLLRKFVETESPTRDKAAADRMGELIKEQLESLGAEIQVNHQEKVGNHLVGHWDGDPQPGDILMLCHFDTVFPVGTLQENPFSQKDGQLTGPGVLDMKAGIAILFTVLGALKETGQWPSRPITALFTSDEETGSHSSRPLIERLAGRSRLTLCLEPAMPDGALKTWRKGVGRFKVTVHGQAAHAGAAHEEGRNAIEELAHQVIKIQSLTDYDRGTTLNVGLISGGTATNVVPDLATAVVDLRIVTPAEADRVTKEIFALQPVLPGTSIEIEGGINRPPMPHNELMAVTFDRAQTIAGRLGLNLLEGGSGGGSDANFVAPLGVPVLDGLGGQGSGMHSDREYVIVSSLPERAALLAAILQTW